MDLSAVIKTSVNDGSGVHFHALSGNIWTPTVTSNSGQIQLVDIDDYIVATLLSYFFSAEQRDTLLEASRPYTRRIPLSNSISIDPSDDRQPMMGVVMSSTTYVGHGDTVSLACFNEDFLRRFLVLSIGNDFGSSIVNLINDTPVDQLSGTLSKALTDFTNGGVVFDVVITKDPKLTISRLTQSDFELVKNEWGGTTEGGTTETPFFDVFDLIRERVTRQELYLDSAGYVPAVYNDNGGDGSNDTIVFTGGYSLDIKNTSNV